MQILLLYYIRHGCPQSSVGVALSLAKVDSSKAFSSNKVFSLYFVLSLVHAGIVPLLRLFLDPRLLQPPEGLCQRQLYVEGFTKVVCMRGDQPFACLSRHAIGGTVCSGHDNMSTGRLINGGLFSLRISPGSV